MKKRRPFLAYALSLTALGTLCSCHKNVTFPPPRGKHLFTFVHLTDPHLSTAEWNQHWHRSWKALFPQTFDKYRANFERAVRDINALRPSFVVVTGDLVMGGKKGGAEDELLFAKGFLEKLEVPVHYLPGDHDLGVGDFAGGVATEAAVVRYEEVFGKGTWSFDHGPVHLVGLTSSFLDGGLERRNEAQRQWLRADLRSSAGKTVLLFAHKRSVLDEYFPLFKDLQVGASFFGHDHRDSEASWHGIRVMTTRATSYVWGAPGYRIVDVYEAGFVSRTVDIGKAGQPALPR